MYLNAAPTGYLGSRLYLNACGIAMMFVTLSNIQNGECVPLIPVLDNQDGRYEIALSEILYYPKWVNISTGNNIFHYAGKAVIIPSGYYDVCSLNSKAFTPVGLELTLDHATGKLSIFNITKNLDLGSISLSLGYTISTPPVVKGVATAYDFSKLLLYKELFVHLDRGLSTTRNRLNQFPSLLLRAIPVKTEECGFGRAETFVRPQFKRLENGTFNTIQISVRTKDNELVDLSYLSCILEIRRRPDSTCWNNIDKR